MFNKDETAHYEKLVKAAADLAALKNLLKARAAGYSGLSYTEVEMLMEMFCKDGQPQEVAEK